MSARSKIARLPRNVRDLVNQRLDNGQTGSQILPWLNGLTEVKSVLDDHFDGKPINDQNLSAWRETGFCEWQTRTEKTQRTKELMEFSLDIADSAGAVLKGARSLTAGKLMALFEGMDDDAQERLLAEHPETFLDLVNGLAKISTAQSRGDRADHDTKKLELEKAKLAEARKKLDLDTRKFETMAATALLKHAQSKEVQAVIKGSGSNAEKIAALRKVMFPQRTSETKS